MSAHVCTMTSSVKWTASKQRIQPVATTAAAESAVDASVTAAAVAGSKRPGLNLQCYLFPQDGDLLYELSVRSVKATSCLGSARASLTVRDSASASTSHCGSGGVGVIPSGRRVPKRSGCLIPQDGDLPSETSMRSLKPPSCLESARASLPASASASNYGSGGVGVILSGR